MEKKTKKKNNIFIKLIKLTWLKSREKFVAKSKKSDVKIDVKWRYVHWVQLLNTVRNVRLVTQRRFFTINKVHPS